MASMDDCFVTEPRDELSWLEGTILAAMRTWVLGRKRGVSTDAAILAMFGNLRASEAAEHMDRFMRGLSEGCTRMIDVYCTCEPFLSPDEVLLMDAFAMMQEGMHDTAIALLRRFVTPAAAYAASGSALAIVQVLSAAGHVIARGPAAVQRHDQSVDDALPGDRAPARLH